MAPKITKPPAKGLFRLLVDGFESALQKGFSGEGNTASRNWAYSAPIDLDAAKCAALYDGNWLARAICDRRVERAFKGGFQASPEALEAYQTFGYNARFPQGAIHAAAMWGRAMGGALLVPGFIVDPKAAKLPLVEGSTLPKIAWVDVFARHQLEVTSKDENPASPSVGQPLTFKVKDHPRKDYEFHVSRSIMFGGKLPSPQAQTGKHENFWTASVLQCVYEDLLRVFQRLLSIDRALNRSSISSITIAGLLEAITTTEQAVLDARLMALQKGIEIANMVLLDEGETYNESSGDSGVAGSDAAVLQGLQMISGGAETPITELFGMSPGGLNATGESDRINYYDSLEAWRSQVAPGLTKFFGWCAGRPEPKQITWVPLLTPTAAERATQAKTELETIKLLDDMQRVDLQPVVDDMIERELLPKTLTLLEPDDTQDDTAGGPAPAPGAPQPPTNTLPPTT